MKLTDRSDLSPGSSSLRGERLAREEHAEGRIAANADKPKGYEPNTHYRFSRHAAELSGRFAGNPGSGAQGLPRVLRPQAGRLRCPARVGTLRDLAERRKVNASTSCRRGNEEHIGESQCGDACDPDTLERASPAARCSVSPTGRIRRWRSVRWPWRAHYLGASLVGRGLHAGCGFAVGPISSHMLRDLAARMPDAAAQIRLTQVGRLTS